MHAITLPDESTLREEPGGDGGVSDLQSLFDAFVAQDWPVLMLERRLPELLRQAPSLTPDDRCAWLGNLHALWHRHGWALTRGGKRALLQLAVHWCAWPLAREVGASMHAATPLDGDDALRLLDACRHLGDCETAVDLAVRLQLMHPMESRYADAHLELQAWQRWRDRMPVADGADWGDEDLRLEPLTHHHLPDFAWQYYDPAIAELCCLPAFRNDTHWHNWLDGIYRAGDQRIFAVLHRDWGFVGCVSLIVHESVGFFYYWMGRDFQRQGLGPRAVSLLLAMARHDYGVQCCYAKVFEHNTPSRRALEKLGFEDLGICGVAPDSNQMFYRCGERRPLDAVVNELHLLLARMGSDTRAAAPVQASIEPS